MNLLLREPLTKNSSVNMYVDMCLVSAVTYSVVGCGSLSVSTKGNWLSTKEPPHWFQTPRRAS